MFDVVVSILRVAEDGFHKLSEGYGNSASGCRTVIERYGFLEIKESQI